MAKLSFLLVISLSCIWAAFIVTETEGFFLKSLIFGNSQSRSTSNNQAPQQVNNVSNSPFNSDAIISKLTGFRTIIKSLIGSFGNSNGIIGSKFGQTTTTTTTTTTKKPKLDVIVTTEVHIIKPSVDGDGPNSNSGPNIDISIDENDRNPTDNQKPEVPTSIGNEIFKPNTPIENVDINAIPSAGQSIDEEIVEPKENEHQVPDVPTFVENENIKPHTPIDNVDINSIPSAGQSIDEEIVEPKENEIADTNQIPISIITTEKYIKPYVPEYSTESTTKGYVYENPVTKGYVYEKPVTEDNSQPNGYMYSRNGKQIFDTKRSIRNQY